MSNVMLNARLSGEYKFIIKSDNGMIRETGWIPNLILDQGLNRLGWALSNTLNPIQYASVGTGTATPVSTQTSLVAPVGYSAAGVFVSIVNGTAPTYTTLQTFSYTFAQGAILGNMSEVGIGSSITGGNLFSRALIVDGAGNPTTITLTSIDQLIVYYRLAASPPLIDYTGSISLNSINYNYTTRLLGAANFTMQYTFTTPAYFSKIYSVTFYGAGAALAPITSSTPTGTASGTNPNVDTNTNTSTYITDTFYNDWIVNCTPAQGNSTGGVQAIAISGGGPFQAIRFQTVFDTPIPKTNTTSLSLTFRYSWSR